MFIRKYFLLWLYASSIVDIWGFNSDVFKCTKPVLPRAGNAIFRETNRQGDLEYVDLINDPIRPVDERGHVSIGPGDSGMPLWRSLPGGNAELVGIWSGGVAAGLDEPRGSYGRNQDDFNRIDHIFQCTNVATKITQEIKSWIYRRTTLPSH